MLQDCPWLSEFCSHFPSLGTDTWTAVGLPSGAQPTEEGLFSPEMPLVGITSPGHWWGHGQSPRRLPQALVLGEPRGSSAQPGKWLHF